MPDSSPAAAPEKTETTPPPQTQETSTQTDVKPEAESSTSATGEKQGSMLDAVKAAIAKPETSPGSTTQETTKPKEDQKSEGDLGEEITEEELKNYTPNSQKRIRQLAAQKKEFQSKVDALAPKAEQFDRMLDTMKKSNLTSQDVDNGINIMGLMKRGEHAKAFELLTPIYAQLAELTGNTLPANLQEEVKLGYLPEQRARELARANAEAASQRARLEAEEKRRAEEAEQQKIAQHVQQTVSAVDGWTARKAEKDPDWQLKQARVTELVELEVHKKGFPQTTQAAVEMCERALATVEADLKRWRPAPQAIASVTGVASTQATAQPKTLLEAVTFAAQQRA